ncbi:MAG TPA: tRNA epoxyqueuosine(34) reductase QueG [Phycisphaerae bacterium]|nr:tRNA epoxyqueuosine(34) reductase QueG [Phycisphaerae bacterium]HOJ76318.1 tRNA epoxyqueuosine(34) reductase QueG [Phycisphaerae bacterium]HOM53732.1 tRNA epoxyqueuosine(34) reductase QueG [Phycisphaerae bacterium]HOQ85642.1 tRNA epoxyqueuosine(34) reductase QueG [Phycisphaerae bacterium]HPP29065.1 tRNA epoxyqueuosine(34) reductase QueG [Phycisphaerae bacterium]
MTPAERTNLVQRLAAEVGLARAGVATAGPVPRADYLAQWLARGWAGEMEYLARYRELRADPRQLLPGARSVIVVADVYRQQEPTTTGDADVAASRSGTDEKGQIPVGQDQPRGRIARYAWGRDYHRVLRKKLHRLADRLREQVDEPFESRVCVDTAPILEREWAAAAGIGWIGKNTLVLNQEFGSFFFLGEIVTTLELAATPPATDHCGTCTRCLEACPTGALTAPHQMDARKCISYLTIEHRGDIDPDLRPRMGDWLYGCDICQDVCPFNRRPPQVAEPAYGLNDRNPLPPSVPLRVIQGWSQEEYDRHLAGSAMKRASLAMLKRNATIVFENCTRTQT